MVNTLNLVANPIYTCSPAFVEKKLDSLLVAKQVLQLGSSVPFIPVPSGLQIACKTPSLFWAGLLVVV